MNKGIKRRSGFVVIALMLALAALFSVACGFVSSGDGPSDDPDDTPTRCVVVFNENGGSLTAPQWTDMGGFAIKPLDPTYAGYTFGGWYTTRDFSHKWDFSADKVNTDVLILYAKWTPVGGGNQGGNQGDEDNRQTCAVMFVSGYGAVLPSLTVDIGDKLTQPDLTRSGYTLDGWYVGNKKWDFATDTVTTETLTLIAKWTENESDPDPDPEPDDPNDPDDPAVGDKTVTVTFNVGLDARLAGLSNPAAVTAKAGGKVSAPDIALDGFTLDGWYKEGTDKKWNFAADTVTQNTTLFAKWQAGEAVEYTPDMRDRGTLYIHYLRANDDYDDWYLYIWSEAGSQNITDTVTIDESGAVFEIDLYSHVCAGEDEVNFIVTQPGWNKDGGDNKVVLDDALRVGDSYHWFVSQGRTANGGTKPTKPMSVGGNAQTEPLRASGADVNRSYAAGLNVSATAQGWDEAGVGYQIFVASFCDSDGDGVGDLRGIISKLDYLQALNADVLWLTPIQSSDSYHGYDCYDYYYIDPKFGTNADYRALVYEAHRRGMKIIMDLVVNHTSPNNEWFIKSKAGVVETVTYQDGSKKLVKYRDFYRWSNTPADRYHSSGDGWYFYSSFGSGMPELNYDCQAVRDAMTDVASYWMGYGLDGFRMDAIKHVFMWDESENRSGDIEGGVSERDSGYNYNLSKNVEFFKEFNYRLKTKYPHCYLLGEQLSGNVNDVAPFYAGMDSLFDFNTYYDLPRKINQSDAGGAASAFNANASLYARYREDRPINSMISSNHDIPRLNEICPENDKARLYMSVIMTMPGLSWIYYGDEIGLIGDKSYGDNGVRQSMKWTSAWANRCTAIPDFSLNGGTASVQEQERDGGSMLAYVRSLTALRNAHPTLINGSASCTTDNGMLKITVTGKGETLTVYHNFSNGNRIVNGTPVFGSNSVPAYGTAVVK